VLEALRKVERVLRHHEHLDVRKLIGHPARNAAGQDYFFRDVGQRIGDSLCCRTEFAGSPRASGAIPGD